MGHKGRVLGPITEVVGSLLGRGSRIADPFCGSGVVSWHFATTFPNPVWAGDLQRFACARSAAILERHGSISDAPLEAWVQRAQATFDSAQPSMNGASASLPPQWSHSLAKSIVFEHRDSAANLPNHVPNLVLAITSAYGGHYFSVSQSLMFDALRGTLPRGRAARVMALSAIIGSASKCSASPGHTAQPFQPTLGAARWLLEAWKRDPLKYIRNEWNAALEYEAQAPGRVVVSDAAALLRQLDAGDVAFLDPPYSGVHYSRFYHVLETLVAGEFVDVMGRGRYPAPEYRPVSKYSQRGKAPEAVSTLLDIAAAKKLRLVITFPFETQSNSLSASMIEHLAKTRFRRVIVHEVSSEFSSLGGRGLDRAARRIQREAIIVAY
jgi:adenine-specific DNA-methyltransferase